MDNWTLHLGSWETLSKYAQHVRWTVFVEEQNVPPELEHDELDAVSLHAVIISDDDEALATGRLLPDGHIGRMAVMKSARGHKLGEKVLLALIEQARLRGDKAVILSAQLQAMGFYANYGFVPEGPTYWDAGIEHRDMRLVF